MKQISLKQFYPKLSHDKILDYIRQYSHDVSMAEGINWPYLDKRLNGEWDEKQGVIVRRDASLFYQIILVINKMIREEEL